jgi:hypothetical protein
MPVLSAPMLSERESDVVRAVLRAAVEGPFFPEWEFEMIMGVDRDETRRVLVAWPDTADPQATDFAVSGAFNNLLGYPHRKWDAWSDYSDADKQEVAEVFRRWRSERGLNRPSSDFKATS